MQTQDHKKLDRQALNALYDGILDRDRDTLLAGGTADPFLAQAAADDRMGLSLVFRPAAPVAARIAAHIALLCRTEPELYCYPAQDLHVTVLDILKGEPGRTLPAGLDRYIGCIGECCRQARPFAVEFDGMTASDSVVMVKGFYSGGLAQVRELVRRALARQELPLEERYETVSAHISAARFPVRLRAPAALLHFVARPVYFGQTDVDTLELVFHNWYDSQKSVLARFPLGGANDMAEHYLCKIASLAEMETKWNDEIARHEKDRANWVTWKGQSLENYKRGRILPYYGILDGAIICEATAMLCPDIVQNSAGLVGGHTVYLAAFRTVERFQGRGYFSTLFRFMLGDLRQRGYTKATLGAESADTKSKAIYAHYGFTEALKTGRETYPDGTVIEVEYYGKALV